MNNLIIRWTVIGVIIIVFFYFASQSDLERAKDKRLDKCIEVMQKAIPDPNDDSRAHYLENCFETTNEN